MNERQLQFELPWQVKTIRFTPSVGSAIDALAEEVSWLSWQMKGASPRAIQSDMAVRNVISGFNQIVETTWAPGRVVVSSELAAFTNEHPDGLKFRLLVGVFGPKGSTQNEALAVRRVVESILGGATSPYELEVVHPGVLLDGVPGDELSHTAIIRQREISVDIGEQSIDILSRWNRTIDGWMAAALICLANAGVPVRVRATVLATQLGVDDHLTLDRALDQVQAIREREKHRPDHDLQLERAAVTLADLKASFATPLLTAEIAIASSEPLAATTLRAFATGFTADVDVHRGNGTVTVAGRTAMLGGFEIVQQPVGLGLALRSGLPLYGGLGPRSLSTLATLTESPIGWAIPVGAAIPTIPVVKSTYLPVPASLRSGVLVGMGMGGVEVRIPEVLVSQHVAILGRTGCGKSALIAARALESLRSRGAAPFLLIDPHGFVADRVAAVAEAEGHAVWVLDPFDGMSESFAPIPLLESDGSNLDHVGRAAGHLADAIMSSLPDVQWAGPRWRQQALAIGYLMAGLGLHPAEAIDIYAHKAKRTLALADERLPDFARRVLSLLNAEHQPAELISWVTSKLDGLISGPSRRLLAAPGQGVDMHEVIRRGKSPVVNLAGLPRGDASLLGHLILASALDAVMDATEKHRPYDIFVDEAPMFPVSSLEQVIHAGRKYNARLWLVAQSTEQCQAGLADAIGATSVQFAFRQTPGSATRLAFMLDVPAARLLDLPDFHAYVKAGGSVTTLDVPRYEPVAERTKATILPEVVTLTPDLIEEPPEVEKSWEPDESASGHDLVWKFAQALRDKATTTMAAGDPF